MSRQIREDGRSFAAQWGWPILLALLTSVGIWAVWYFTKVPCIMVRAEAGLCNPGVLASFINADILVKSGGGGLAVGALKGGYDRYMLKKEREARQHAEEQLAEARQEVIKARRHAEEQLAEARQQVIEARQEVIEVRQEAAEARHQADAARQQAIADAYGMVTEIIAEFREERRQNEEERRQNSATQQAMLETMRQLLQQQGANGSSAANDTETPDHD